MSIRKRPKICLDANVLISYLRQEVGRDFKLLSQESERFFTSCSDIGAVIVLSELFFKEIKNAIGLGKQDALEALNGFGLKTELLEGKFKDSDLEPFRHLAAHRSDAIYVYSTKASGASCLVTWNKKHFEGVAGMISVLSPTEFSDAISQCTPRPVCPSSPE